MPDSTLAIAIYTKESAVIKINSDAICSTTEQRMTDFVLNLLKQGIAKKEPITPPT
jgi:hypothetical protein